MYMRKHVHAPTPARRRLMTAGDRQFAPEAYADFPAVPDEKIEEARQEMAERFDFGSGAWEVVEDVAR